MMIIREAALSDAEGITKVHVDSWRTTYKGIVSDVFLEQLSYKKRTKSWIENIQRLDNYVVVAENDDGQIVGFADGGKRESNLIEHSGDMTAIYILEEYQGKGIGKKLVGKLFEHFKKLGYKKIFVEVLEDNKSRLFYEKLGAQYCETTKITIQGDELNLAIYKWENINSLLTPR